MRNHKYLNPTIVKLSYNEHLFNKIFLGLMTFIVDLWVNNSPYNESDVFNFYTTNKLFNNKPVFIQYNNYYILF